jgi:hypothetical protein
LNSRSELRVRDAAGNVGAGDVASRVEEPKKDSPQINTDEHR